MKKLLIVVDFQKDFVDGSLGFSGAELLDEPIYNKVLEYKSAGGDIAFTFDTHTDEYLNTQEGRALPVPHCVKDSKGWQLYGKTAELLTRESICFLKASYGSMELCEYVRDKNYGSVELVGLVSNICVLSNGVLLRSCVPECKVIVDAACTASFDKELHEKALAVMKGIQIEILNA